MLCFCTISLLAVCQVSGLAQPPPFLHLHSLPPPPSCAPTHMHYLHPKVLLFQSAHLLFGSAVEFLD